MAESKEPEEEQGKDMVDRMVNRFTQALDQVEVKSRSARENLRRELKAAARDVRRLVDHGLGSIDAFISNPQERPVVVMTRLSRQDVKAMDLLVDSGLFESRSQCASYFINAGLEARKDLLEKVQDTSRRINDLRDDLKRTLS